MLRRIALALALAACLTPQRLVGQSTLVYIVRHAEKGVQPAANPVLTPEGEARAQALSAALASAGIKAIVSTQFERALATVRPLATKLGVAVDTVAVSGAVPAHAQAVAAAVRKHAGAPVLVVGHSNTINAIAMALGAPQIAELCDGDYDQLFIVEIPAQGAARFTRARYGEPAADANCRAMK
jgi:broad specificity phosphatase PhoE